MRAGTQQVGLPTLDASSRMQRNTWTDKESAQHVDMQAIVDQITSSRTVRLAGKPKPRDDYAERFHPAGDPDDPLTF